MAITLNNLSFEILTCIADYLTSKELCKLSQCSRKMYQLQYMDSLWKKYCSKDFGIQYNHPDQTYRELFITCYNTQKGRSNEKRLPCNHIHDGMMAVNKHIDIVNQCQRCPKEGHENLFICISPQCHQTMCDRHSRQHARYSGIPYHSIFYKMNTSELFCQVCVDWVGGIDSHPAEQHITSLISNQLSHYIQLSNNEEDDISKLKIKRQIERRLRWEDTPQFIMRHDFCFISSSWMAEWEMFIEGWKTLPPNTIDQTQLLSSVVGLNRVGTNPFYLNSNNSVMIISNQAWEYISKHYKVKGDKITELDLKPIERFDSIITRLNYWKKRASDFKR